MNKQWRKTFAAAALTGCLLPGVSLAATSELVDIYEKRPDLQAAFDSQEFRGIPGSSAGFLIDLEDWARQYGWKEYPELTAYKPIVLPVQPSDVQPLPEVTAEHYIIIDEASGEILAADGADQVWPVASITKLVTTKTAFQEGLDFYGTGTVENADDVGGAKLYVDGGTKFFVKDLVYATLVASANNAANAVARLSGTEHLTFIKKMNDYAASLKLRNTKFVDPTGIEVENVSTAREVAAIARDVFADRDLRRISGSWRMMIAALNDPDYVREIKNTNQLLYDPKYDDVYVTAGKTGFLYESGWNLVVRMHPMGMDEDRSVLVVTFGSDSRPESFDDAHQLAHWAWKSFDWSAR